MAAPEVAVIVTTYEQPWHLERVLASLALQTCAPQMEVVVSDDGSRDETEGVVEQFRRRAPFPVAWVSQPHEGFRLAACRNRGVAQSRAEHLLILDGDCVVPRDHVAQHLAAHRTGVVTNTYCVRLDRPTSERITLAVIESGAYTAWAPRAQLRQLNRMQWKSRLYRWLRHPNRPRLRGGNVGLSRQDFQRVNGLDEAFRGWGGEDDDFGLRLRAAGLRIEYILDRTRTYHLWHPPAPTRPDRIGMGPNVAYLNRQVRLTRCVHGATLRPRSDLVCSVSGVPHDEQVARQFFAARHIRLSSTVGRRPDVELLFVPSDGRFRGTADYRALITATDTTVPRRLLKSADIVVSPGARLGNDSQIRVAWENPSDWWTALGWPALTTMEKAA